MMTVIKYLLTASGGACVGLFIAALMYAGRDDE